MFLNFRFLTDNIADMAVRFTFCARYTLCAHCTNVIDLINDLFFSSVNLSCQVNQLSVVFIDEIDSLFVLHPLKERKIVYFLNTALKHT
jgi:hypothetical protein